MWLHHALVTSMLILVCLLAADSMLQPTKGELAKAIRLLIANARDDEDLFDQLGRHW